MTEVSVICFRHGIAYSGYLYKWVSVVGGQSLKKQVKQCQELLAGPINFEHLSCDGFCIQESIQETAAVLPPSNESWSWFPDSTVQNIDL